MLFHWYTEETNNRIRWFLCSMWLPTVHDFTRNAKSPYNVTRRMSTDQWKGIHRSHSPVTTFNPHTTFIAEIARRNWNFLQSKERLGRIFKKPPLVAYRGPISLRDRLVSTKFKTVGNTPLPRGCKACGKPKCSWCKEINKTTTFTSSNNTKIFKIFHSVNCQSSWVIYIIECNICNLQSTIHRQERNSIQSSLKQPQKSYQKGNQQLWTYGTHNFDNNVIITIIEQIRKGNKSNEQKKDLLRRREIFWQKKLNSMQPNGLNKRIG